MVPLVENEQNANAVCKITDIHPIITNKHGSETS